MQRYKSKHNVKWFIRRIGEDVIKDNHLNLFQPPVVIASLDHAKALHAAQDKGHRYSQEIEVTT